MRIVPATRAFSNNPASPAPARDCHSCNGWGTLVAPNGRGLIACPDCQDDNC
ncbi:hypothetical protein [Streptomyces sp. NRRL B-24484]|uniref:hypothetical protein n=1 Tax=Streptomyces sp. NRRL B-24484 TaxID=1463833 RepID=UPI000A8D1E0A|nr:hypothetical protein [Streptomyces sp. NRRL B-24484]